MKPRAPIHEPALLAVAEKHLPAAALPRWRQLLKPTICLEIATPGEPVAGHFGGDEALLPPDAPWPHWDEYGPLSPWLTIDCAALPRTDPQLPDSGRLQFFFAEGQLWGDRTPWTLGASAGFPEAGQVVYVPARAESELRRAPEPLRSIAYEPLTAWPDLTGPRYPQNEWRKRFGDADLEVLQTLASDDFDSAYGELVWDRLSGFHIGGYQCELQDPVEDELIHYAVFDGEDIDDERFTTELARWRPLLQSFPLDGRAEDYWHLYWFITHDDLAARRFESALMVEQCT